MRITVLIAVVFAYPAWADCPSPPDHSDALNALFAQAADAPNEAAGRALSDKMWEYWTDAPDAVAQEMLDRGMNRRSGYDFFGALAALTELVNYCPDYAEGYNQRAFVNYLRQDFNKALPDLDQAIALNPTHIGALSGRALTLLALGREAEAQRDLRAAVLLNPWLSERALIREIEPEGEDL